MNISQNFLKYNFLFDRYGGDVLTLPYDFESIRIQPNDTATASLINTKFSYLFENLMYIYRACKVASNLIPVSATGFAGVSSNSTVFTWHYNLSTSEFIPLSDSSSYIDLYNIVRTDGVVNEEQKTYSIFATNGYDLFAIKSDLNNTSLGVAISTKTYNPDFNSGIDYQKINEITIGPNNTLFTIDLSSNYIYKYDITGFKINDNVLNNKIFYNSVIGGYGTIYDKYEFNSPRAIAYYGENIYVLDSGNGCVKKYDYNFNWLQTYNLIRDMLSAYPISMRAAKDGKFVVLNKNKSICIYDNNFDNKIKIDIGDELEGGEELKDIRISATDSNIFYIITDKNVYKRFVSNPFNSIGKYLFYYFKQNTPYTIQSFTSIPTELGDKNLIFIKSNNNTNIILSFLDNANLYDVLSIPDFDIYDLDNININYEEYMQSWIFNKAISKMLLNIMRLRDQIIGKFLFSRDSFNNVVFNFTRYLTEGEKQKIFFQQDLNNSVGINEVFSNAVVNRCLEKLYNYQYNLIEILMEETYRAPLSGAIFNLE